MKPDNQGNQGSMSGNENPQVDNKSENTEETHREKNDPIDLQDEKIVSLLKQLIKETIKSERESKHEQSNGNVDNQELP